MSDLDKRLEEKLGQRFTQFAAYAHACLKIDPPYPKTALDREDALQGQLERTVGEIKQAFIDDGWVKIRNHELAEKCFTGQEWYDGFESEYKAIASPFKFDHKAYQAAKKAAGIVDE